MPFKPDFEGEVNANMQQPLDTCEAGPAPLPTPREKEDDLSESSFPPDNKIPHDFPADDKDASPCEEKKGVPPPRFSALYNSPTPSPPSQPQHLQPPYLEPPPPPRRSGVFVPTPLLILLSLLFLCMSAALFAYTVIGLYSNLPRAIFAGHGPATPGGRCVLPGDNADQQHLGIWIPGAADATVTVTTTLAPGSGTSFPGPAATSSSSAAGKAQGLSSVLAMLTNLPTATPTSSERSTVRSTQILTVDEEGETLAEMSTSTSTTIVDAPTVTAEPEDED